MASTQALTNQAKVDFLSGVHLPGDTYKLALYTSSATLNKASTVYTSYGECTGTGYVAGGAVIPGPYTVTLLNDMAYIDFPTTQGALWSNVTLTGVVTALLYNSSRSNKAIAVFTFASVDTISGSFLAKLPEPGATALIRFS